MFKLGERSLAHLTGGLSSAWGKLNNKCLLSQSRDYDVVFVIEARLLVGDAGFVLCGGHWAVDRRCTNHVPGCSFPA
jgi:hypothetical protein